MVKAEKSGERDVTFTFDGPGNRELPLIVGQLNVLPKHWWEGTDASGKKRDVGATTLEPPLGNGAYRIKEFVAGRSVVFERVKDYWGKDLNVNIGRDNFDELRIEYFRDDTVALEAFKGDQVDWRSEASAKGWATAYDFPAVKDKRVLLEEFPISNVGRMQGFAFNIRRDKFGDPRLRRAFNLRLRFRGDEQAAFLRPVSSASAAISKAPSWPGMRRTSPAGRSGRPCRKVRSSKSSRPCATRYRRKCSPRPTPIRSAAAPRRCVAICARRCGCSRKPATRSATASSSTSRPASR